MKLINIHRAGFGGRSGGWWRYDSFPRVLGGIDGDRSGGRIKWGEGGVGISSPASSSGRRAHRARASCANKRAALTTYRPQRLVIGASYRRKRAR